MSVGAVGAEEICPPVVTVPELTAVPPWELYVTVKVLPEYVAVNVWVVVTFENV